MTVRQHDTAQYKLSCDGPDCENYFIVGTSHEELKKADDWLQRHGWRTIGGKLHYCPYDVNKLDVFHPKQEKTLRY